MGLPLSKDDDQLDDEEEIGVLQEARAADVIQDELLPHCGMEDEEVEVLNVPYSTRAPDDWVSSGTLDPNYAGERRLRYFPTWDDAERWARGFFGDRFKGRVQEAVDSNCSRWCFLIRGPRGQGVVN